MTNASRLPTRPILTHSVVQRMLVAAVAKVVLKNHRGTNP
jgi:hypothetical protein